jgi:plastocyanin
MKTFTILPAVAVAGALAASTAAAPPTQHHVTIRHQVQHCHAWSVDGGPFAAHVDVSLRTGGALTLTNNDVMPHRVIERSGPHAVFHGTASLSHMGASTKVTFPRAGVYRFTTKAGEDYMKGVKTVGEDNVLTMKVVVH